MIDRESLAAQLYAINYVKPCFRKDTAFYLTPKQAFRAADHFLKEATKQRATSTMSFVGGVTAQDPFEERCPSRPCDHIFGPLTNSFDGSTKGSYCIKCGAKEEPAKAKPREWAILVDAKGGVLTVQDQEYNSDGRMIKVREILDTEEGNEK